MGVDLTGRRGAVAGSFLDCEKPASCVPSTAHQRRTEQTRTVNTTKLGERLYRVADSLLGSGARSPFTGATTRQETNRSMSTRRLLAAAGLGCAVLILTTTAACSGDPGATGQTTSRNDASQPGQGSSAAPTTASEPPPPVKFSSNVADGSSGVKVDTKVAVRASAGTMSTVKVTYSAVEKGITKKGTISGKLDQAKKQWKATELLEPSGTYTVKMTGKNEDGEVKTETSSFTTQELALAQQAFSTITPAKGATVGVGMPAVVRFDVPIKNKASIERHLQVTSTPEQTGSWHWYGDREVHWRPKSYWKPGTKVSVRADVNSVNAGGGIYGQKSVSSSFTVGRAMVVKVDLSSHVASVYKDQKKIRTIAISGGKSGWRTRSGTKLIMSKDYNVLMTNEMIGAAESYRLTVAYALRITNSGEFLHSAPWNTRNLGRANTSHGCVGMSTSDAAWLIRNAMIGDPVVTTGSNRGIEPGNGFSDWNASFKDYAKGSAL